ncbi:hypothetical protein Tco_1366200 [Tanacetum coccineum]
MLHHLPRQVRTRLRQVPIKFFAKGNNSHPTLANICKGMATDSTRVPPKMVPGEPPEKAVVSPNPPPKKAPSKDKSITKKIKNITLKTINESSSEKTKIRNLEPVTSGNSRNFKGLF